MRLQLHSYFTCQSSRVQRLILLLSEALKYDVAGGSDTMGHTPVPARVKAKKD